MSDFSNVGLLPQLVTQVNNLGYEQATPIQLAAIPVILSGKDIMAGAQTGTGKTAAFGLPIIQFCLQTPLSDNAKTHSNTVRALILTPTRELAQQVHRNIEQYANETSLNIQIAYGGVSLTPQIAKLRKGADILIATPGRLIDLMYKKVIHLGHLTHLVFDEADRMLDMGFIDDIKRILKQLPTTRQTMMFSATFDDAIFKLSKQLLVEPELIEVDARNTAAQTVEQVIYNVDADRKRELVSHLIGAKNWQQVLIFVRTKQGADELAKEMCKDGVNAKAIHGDKSQGRRESTLADFKVGKVRALVATDVAARGLDIQDLQYVINYELPHIAEDYIHRIGRTGRAGNQGMALSLMSEEENWLLEEIEVLLDSRIPQQWLPGYEPDLTKARTTSRKNTKTAQARRAKQRGRGRR
ncbi:DEAD/DEAH box helicase [Algibacillus agarilyticus]|uniref:DEAD/DEAH box helicase n=1 Tax=Algibacillus agarilyticus TaxID=2234133 RepID=UPI000DD0C065|nr:DEAD/DEAH box helicase [Algibacillus agarilyticus]